MSSQVLPAVRSAERPCARGIFVSLPEGGRGKARHAPDCSLSRPDRPPTHVPAPMPQALPRNRARSMHTRQDCRAHRRSLVRALPASDVSSASVRATKVRCRASASMYLPSLYSSPIRWRWALRLPLGDSCARAGITAKGEHQDQRDPPPYFASHHRAPTQPGTCACTAYFASIRMSQPGPLLAQRRRSLEKLRSQAQLLRPSSDP